MMLFDQLRDLHLPAGDYAIFGSGPLIIRGIIPASNDLDIICRRGTWEQVKAIGELEYLSEYDLSIVKMCDGHLSFGSEWGIGKFEIDELIDNAEIIEGLPFVRLEHVQAYKRISRRPKDLEHLKAIADELKKESKCRMQISD